MNESNELLALARQVARLRYELGFEQTDKETYKLFVRMVDELTSVVFKMTGRRSR